MLKHHVCMRPYCFGAVSRMFANCQDSYAGAPRLVSEWFEKTNMQSGV